MKNLIKILCVSMLCTISDGVAGNRAKKGKTPQRNKTKKVDRKADRKVVSNKVVSNNVIAKTPAVTMQKNISSTNVVKKKASSLKDILGRDVYDLYSNFVFSALGITFEEFIAEYIITQACMLAAQKASLDTNSPETAANELVAISDVSEKKVAEVVAENTLLIQESIKNNSAFNQRQQAMAMLRYAMPDVVDFLINRISLTGNFNTIEQQVFFLVCDRYKDLFANMTLEEGQQAVYNMLENLHHAGNEQVLIIDLLSPDASIVYTLLVPAKALPASKADKLKPGQRAQVLISGKLIEGMIIYNFGLFDNFKQIKGGSYKTLLKVAGTTVVVLASIYGLGYYLNKKGLTPPDETASKTQKMMYIIGDKLIAFTNLFNSIFASIAGLYQGLKNKAQSGWAYLRSKLPGGGSPVISPEEQNQLQMQKQWDALTPEQKQFAENVARWELADEQQRKELINNVIKELEAIEAMPKKDTSKWFNFFGMKDEAADEHGTSVYKKAIQDRKANLAFDLALAHPDFKDAVRAAINERPDLQKISWGTAGGDVVKGIVGIGDATARAIGLAGTDVDNMTPEQRREATKAMVDMVKGLKHEFVDFDFFKRMQGLPTQEEIKNEYSVTDPDEIRAYSDSLLKAMTPEEKEFYADKINPDGTIDGIQYVEAYGPNGENKSYYYVKNSQDADLASFVASDFADPSVMSKTKMKIVFEDPLQEAYSKQSASEERYKNLGMLAGGYGLGRLAHGTNQGGIRYADTPYGKIMIEKVNPALELLKERGLLSEEAGTLKNTGGKYLKNLEPDYAKISEVLEKEIQRLEEYENYSDQGSGASRFADELEGIPNDLSYSNTSVYKNAIDGIRQMELLELEADVEAVNNVAQLQRMQKHLESKIDKANKAFDDMVENTFEPSGTQIREMQDIIKDLTNQKTKVQEKIKSLEKGWVETIKDRRQLFKDRGGLKGAGNRAWQKTKNKAKAIMVSKSGGDGAIQNARNYDAIDGIRQMELLELEADVEAVNNVAQLQRMQKHLESKIDKANKAFDDMVENTFEPSGTQIREMQDIIKDLTNQKTKVQEKIKSLEKGWVETIKDRRQLFKDRGGLKGAGNRAWQKTKNKAKAIMVSKSGGDGAIQNARNYDAILNDLTKNLEYMQKTEQKVNEIVQKLGEIEKLKNGKNLPSSSDLSSVESLRSSLQNQVFDNMLQDMQEIFKYSPDVIKDLEEVLQQKGLREEDLENNLKGKFNLKEANTIMQDLGFVAKFHENMLSKVANDIANEIKGGGGGTIQNANLPAVINP